MPVQRQIIEEVDHQLYALGALDKQLGIVEARGRVLRMATLATAFSGGLVPQDESDEPVSIMLALIASERESVNSHKFIQRRKPRALEEVTE